MGKEKKLVCFKNKKGSILAYSLIIISVMVTIATSLSVSALIGKKSASGTEHSIQALQTADSGMLLALKKVNVELIKASPGSIDTALGAGFCVGSKATFVLGAGPNQSVSEVSFFDENGALLNCSTIVSQISNIKSIGTYRDTVRAVSANVADSMSKLLLHADGAGNAFIDSSRSPKNITANGSATQANNPKKFGAASFEVSDNSGNLSLPNNSGFNITSGAWSMDCWVYPTGNYIGDYMNLFGDGQGVWPNRWIWDFSQSSIRYASQSNTIVWDVTATINKNSWNHFAIASDGANAFMFVNGALVGTRASFNPGFFSTPAVARQSGAAVINATNRYYIDEFRFTKGTARWTAPFVPPTAPYTS